MYDTIRLHFYYLHDKLISSRTPQFSSNSLHLFLDGNACSMDNKGSSNQQPRLCTSFDLSQNSYPTC
jgi:hypothetical protein